MSEPTAQAHRMLNLTQRDEFLNKYSTARQLEAIQYLLDRPFSCKYCGMPTGVDPSDQVAPPDYCGEH